MQTKHAVNKPGKYLRLRNDFAFKRTFRNEKRPELLMRLLQELIPERQIVSITFGSTEQIPELEQSKRPVYDILCTEPSGTTFIVELQVNQYPDYFDRLVYYSSFYVTIGLRRGEPYSMARPVYVISILDYILESENGNDDDKLVLRANIRIEGREKALSNSLNLLFLQLPKVTSITEESSWIDKYAYTIRHSEEFSDIPKELRDDDYFKQLLSASENNGMTIEERMQYDMLEVDDIQRQAEKDFAMQQGLKQGMQQGIQQGMQQGIQQGIQQGMQQGIQQGIQQGREEVRTSLIPMMLSNGISAESIADMLGIPLEQILQYAK